MDLHEQFKSWLNAEELTFALEKAKSLNSDTVRRQIERQIDVARAFFYAGAQAAQAFMVEASTDPKLSPDDASRAMLKLQRQTSEGLQS